MTAQDYMAPESVGRLQQRALGVGVVGLVAFVICFFLYKDQFADQFFHSYLIAFMFVLGLSLGSLGLLMLQHLTGGHWGIVIRRPLESATRVLPVVAVLFVPIAIFGMKHLYGEWLNAPPKGEGSLSELQKSYLVTGGVLGFYGRAVIYFAIWLALVFIFNLWSKEQDVNREDRALRRRLRMLAGPGIILYVFVMTFAAIDWVMSLSPHWASTIYGFLFVVGQLISSMSLMIAVLVLLSRTAPMHHPKPPSARPRQTPSSLRHALGLFRFFAALDYLVRELARGDQFLSLPSLRRLGRRRRARADLPFFCAVLFALVSRPQAQRAAAAESRPLAYFHAPRRSVLAHTSGVHLQRYARLDGCCRRSRPRRNLVRCLREKSENSATFAAGRS